jgi:hypothetical protein
MLKQWLLAMMLIGLVYAVTPSVVAQDNGSNDQPPASAGVPLEHGHGRGDFDPAKRTEMLTKKLKLTSDQQSKVQEILNSEQSQMETLRSDSSLSREDRRPKMMEIHKASASQIRALLDPNQQKKWDEMQSRHEQWQGHNHEGQSPGATPDSGPK